MLALALLILAPLPARAAEDATLDAQQIVKTSSGVRCSDVALQIHTQARRPPHVQPTRITLGIRNAKAFRSHEKWGEQTRVEATLFVHNDGPAAARFFFGESCGQPTLDDLRLFAVDAAGEETELTPEPSIEFCLSGGSDESYGVRLKRNATFSGAVTRFAKPLQPGKYQLLVRYRAVSERGERAARAPGWIWHGSAESTPVELVVP